MSLRAPVRHSLVSFLVLACAVVAACVGEDPVSSGVSPDGGTSTADAAGSQADGDTNVPRKALGEGCSSAGDCESGFCADGVCCNTACSGQCEACAGATKGTCSPVTGVPIAPRQPCTGAGTSCGGTCDGTSSSCTYVAAATVCGGSCAGTCDGAGTCSDKGSGSCPGGFACGGAGKCLTSCTAKGECQPNFDCNLSNNLCERVPESDCFDGADNNGDGLADCQDPTCVDTAATCVPAVGAGAAIGTVVDQLPCPAGFAGTTQSLYAGIKSGSCTGCSCNTKCSGSLAVYSGASCTGGAISLSTTGINGGNSGCTNSADGNYQSIRFTNLARNGCQGSGTATWQAASPAWNTSKVFCEVSRSSMTCGQNQLCVPKVASGISSKVAAAGACPSGYTGSQATYYTGYSSGACSSCSSCNASTTFNCAAIGFAYSGDNACGGANKFVGANVSNYTSSCTDFGGTVNIKSMRLDWFSFDGDSCTSNVSVNTQPAGTNGQLVCNVP